MARYVIPVMVLCDGCGRAERAERCGAIVFVPHPQQPGLMRQEPQQFALPQRWTEVQVHPQVVTGGEINPFQSATDVAAATGAPQPAWFCGACAGKVTSKRIVGEALASAKSDELVDERQLERDAEKARAEAEAEAAERAAFEARRQRSEPEQGGEGPVTL